MVFGVIIVLAVTARWVGITKSSIWHDEGYSAMLASRDWLGIWLGSARDVHPPLYYELLHGWSVIFGNSALALRSLSAVCGVAVVGLGYLIVDKITKRHNIAALAGVILALNPFLIRYSQEARMYGVLGVFMLVAMLGLIMIVRRNNRWLGYALYILGISAGLYTHYFTVLVVASFWLYVASLYIVKGNKKIKLLSDWRWWGANVLAVIIFLPWIPNMINQITSGQGLGWLSKTSIATFNDTIWQFFTFTDAHLIGPISYWVLPLGVLAAILYISILDKSKERFVRLLAIFTLLPILSVIVISLVKPVFHQRYFVFSALSVCMLLAIYFSSLVKKHRAVAVALALVVISLQLVGIRNVYSQGNHQMGNVMDALNQQYLPGDSIISAELYTYFDSSFYNQTGSRILLYTHNGRPNGYGESGLLYDKGVYTDSFTSLPPGRVWLIGKTGQHDYYDSVPPSWVLKQSYRGGYSEARLYQIQ